MSWRVLRVRMWELGHTFEEIDNLTLEQLDDIVGYWAGKANGEEKLRRTNKKLRS